MATLLENCQAAIEEIDGFDVPGTIFGNDDPTAILLKRCANRVGRELARDYKWQELKAEHTITTTSGDSDYAFPTDIQRFANLTFWNDTDQWPLVNVSDIGWRELQSGIVVSGVRFYFSVFGDQVNLYPTPSSSFTIKFDYYSSYFAKASDGTEQEEFEADTDTFRLPDDVLILGVLARFKMRKGLSADAEIADYRRAVVSHLRNSRPDKMIDVGGVNSRRGLQDQIVDSSWDV